MLAKQEFFFLVEAELNKIEEARNADLMKVLEEELATGQEELGELQGAMDTAFGLKDAWEKEDTRLRELKSKIDAHPDATDAQKEKIAQDLSNHQDTKQALITAYEEAKGAFDEKAELLQGAADLRESQEREKELQERNRRW